MHQMEASVSFNVCTIFLTQEFESQVIYFHTKPEHRESTLLILRTRTVPGCQSLDSPQKDKPAATDGTEIDYFAQILCAN